MYSRQKDGRQKVYKRILYDIFVLLRVKWPIPFTFQVFVSCHAFNMSEILYL